MLADRLRALLSDPCPSSHASPIHAPGDGRTIRSHLVVIFLLPLILLLMDPSWVFTPRGYLDPWMYHGFMRNPKAFVSDLFPRTYYGSRMSHVAVGAAFHAILPMLAATIALHLFWYYMAVFSLYTALKRVATPGSALVAASLLGTNALFLVAVGGDYVDGSGIAYYLLAAALLVRAVTGSKRWLWLALAGGACAACFYTNLVWAPLLAILATYFPYVLKRDAGVGYGRSVPFGLAYGLLGFGILTFAICLVNSFVLGGLFFFYWPSIDYARSAARQPNPWQPKDYSWLGQAAWLVWPTWLAASSLLAAMAAVARRPLWQNASAVFFCLAMLLSFTVFVALEAKGMGLVAYHYYVSYLLAPAFLALGAIWLPLPPEWDRRVPVHVLALGGVLAILAFQFHPASRILWLVPWIVLLGACACMVLGALASKRRWGMVPALAAAFVLCAYSCLSVYGRFQIMNIRRAQWTPPAAHAFARITSAEQYLERNRDGRKPGFWFDAKEANGPEYHSLASVYLWMYSMVGWEFPALNRDSEGKPIPPDDAALIVIPSQHKDAVDRANATLQTVGRKARLLSQCWAESGGEGYWLTLCEMVPLEPPPRQSLEMTLPPSGDEPVLNLPDDSVPKPWPLDKWKPWLSSWLMSSELKPDGLHVKTSWRRYGYALQHPAITFPADGTYCFRLTCHMLHGGLTFGLLSEDQSRWAAQVSASGWKARHMQLQVTVKAGDRLVPTIANWHPVGSRPSSFVVRELAVYRNR